MGENEPKPQAVVVKRTKQLTGRQEKFVQEYLREFNGRQAAINAGYKVKGAAVAACRLLKYQYVKMAVEKGKARIVARIQGKLEITRDDLIKHAQGIMDEGELERDRLKANELIGKYLGLFEEKLTVRHEIDLSALPQEELDRMEHAILEGHARVVAGEPATLPAPPVNALADFSPDAPKTRQDAPGTQRSDSAQRNGDAPAACPTEAQNSTETKERW